MKSHIPNVTIASILAEPAGQRKFAGLFSYLGTVHRWNLRILRAQDEIAAFFADKKALNGMDGIIYSGRYDKAAFKAIAALPCPVVVMENESPELERRTHNLIVIRNDADEIAKAALKTFMEMGKYKSFAYVGDLSGQEWSKRRESAFPREVVEKTAMQANVYSSLAASPDIDRPRLADFLSGLEQPAAVLAANDMRAMDVVAAAKKAKISVPGKLAVLGIDNDPYVCDSTSPALSSIEPDFHAEGAAAAELLDKMMRSRVPKSARHLFFGVKRVVIRESTPRLPLAESLVARAKEFIDKHATDGISPGDVAAHLGISRALLDLRFRETQRTSVGKLITATKLSEVARKLRETRLSIAAIQETCGFKNANALKNLFKRRHNMSMRAYRAKSR
jgi:LacI family transcriptional regulator